MASIEDFVKRITRMNRRFSFVFTEDFFSIVGKTGVQTDRFRDIRNTIKHIGHRKGTRAEAHADADTPLFDVEVVVVDRGFSCFVTTFDELANGPFGGDAIIYGSGNDLVEAQKAKFQVDSFLSDKHHESMSTLSMIAARRKRQLVLVVESAADLKRPSLEPLLKLRSQLCKILISPVKGPVVDCQVSKIYQDGNSSSLSTLLNMFCVHYK